MLQRKRNQTINPAKKYLTIVIVRLDRTIQKLMKSLDSPIKSVNDEHKKFKCLLAGLIKGIVYAAD